MSSGSNFGVDSFGVKKLYADNTAKASENWTMGNMLSDSRIRVDGTITDKGGGEWEGHVTSSDNPASFRINVNTTNPNAMDPNTQSILGTDWRKLLAAGYMVDAKDFRNVEMTIYWKVLSWSDSDEMSLYCRGGRHSSGWPAGCLGMCYKGQIQKAGNSRWAKEYHHNSGSTGYWFTAGHNTSTLGDRTNVWTGQKVVVFDKTVNGKPVVRMEVWKETSDETNGNPSTQNWQMINWLEDDGTNTSDPSDTGFISNCHGVSKQQFLWGGPTATFRIDNVIVRVKKASVRHIVGEGTGSVPPPTCPSGQHYDETLQICVQDSPSNPPPPPPPTSGDLGTPIDYVKFYLSGTTTNNSNPFQSLGGPISNVEVQPNSFQNLFEDLDAASQRTGKKSNRVIYAKNTSGTTALPDTRTFFNEVDNFTKVALGAAAINGTESTLITEDPGTGDPTPGTGTGDVQHYYPIYNTGISQSNAATEKLDNTYSKIANHFTSTDNPAIGSKPLRFTVFGRKVGTPTGNMTAEILDSANSVKLNFTTVIDVSTLTTSASLQQIQFTLPSNPNITLANGDRIDVKYSGGTASNYVEIAVVKDLQHIPAIECQKWNGTTWSTVATSTTNLALNSTLPVQDTSVSTNAATRVTVPGKVVDRGGVVLSNAKVVIIYWGTNSSKAYLDQRISALFQTPYFSKLREYASIQPPTLFGTYVNTRTTVKNFAVADVVKCITDTIADHPEIKPTATATTQPFLYCVITNGTATMTDVSGAGAYHTYANSVNGRIWFSACGPYTHDNLHLDYVIAGLTHEIVETVVDPEQPVAMVFPLSNGSGDTEICDVCIDGVDGTHIWGQPGFNGVFSSYLTAPNGTQVLCAEYFSNLDNKCVVPSVTYQPSDPSGTTTTAIIGSIDALASSGSGGSATFPPGLVIYNNGDFITHLKVQLVFWGSQWNTQSNPSKNQIISATQSIISGPYFSKLRQYKGIGPATYLGQYTDTTHTTFTEAGMLQMIYDHFRAGDIPNALVDNTILTMVMIPNGKAVDGDVASAAHNWFFEPSTSKNVPFAFVNPDSDFGVVTIGLSHEMVETATNPFYSDTLEGFVVNRHCQTTAPQHDEICDVCDVTQPGVNCTYMSGTQSGGNVGGIICDKYWSNADSACVAPSSDDGSFPISTDQTLQTVLQIVAGAGSINLSSAGFITIDDTKTKVAVHIWGTQAPIYNQRVVKIDVFMRKVGSPTGSIHVGYMQADRVDPELATYMEGGYHEVFAYEVAPGDTSLDASGLSSAYTKVTFTRPTTLPSFEPKMNDAIMFIGSGMSATNYVQMATGDKFDILNYPGSATGMNLEYFDSSRDPITWHNFLPAGDDFSYNPAGAFYIDSTLCFGSGGGGTTNPPGTGGGGGGIVLKQPQTYDEGLIIGTLNPGDYKSLVLQRNIPANSPDSVDTEVELIVAAGGTTSSGGGGTPTPCPSGQHYDATLNTCVPDVVTTPPPPVGSCSNSIYPPTGNKMTAVDSGVTTRHFASDGSSPTTEREVNNCPFENYEMTSYQNIPSDEASFKMWGPNHTDSTCCWYMVVVSSNGDTHFGYEQPHPTTNKDCFRGPNIGNVGSKVIGIKGVIWKLASGSGAHVELWTDTGTGKWVKQLSADNPCGKVFSKVSNQQVLFRIDARPVTFNCAEVVEIKPNPSAVSATAFVFPTAQDTTNLSPGSGGTPANTVQSESNEEDNTVS